MTLEKLRVVNNITDGTKEQKNLQSSSHQYCPKGSWRWYGTDLDVGGLVESVHLVEQLEQDPLHFPVSPGLSIEPAHNSQINIYKELSHEMDLAFDDMFF